MSDQSILKVRDLTKSYFSEVEEFRILKGLNFEIPRGEFISIMGPSGSGKSTLMHILGGLDRPTTGSYTLEDQELSELSDEELSKVRNSSIGFVFQAFYLIPHNTVLENVLLPSRYGSSQEVREGVATRLLEAIGLGERLHFKPNQISGGQCQRAAIARALLNDPAIIMADEPTGNLDSKTGEDIIAILQYLNSQGKTILMVTHERDVAMHTSRILHLKDGEIDRWEVVEEPIKACTSLSFNLQEIFEGN